jgi:hypothetical protein
MSDRYIVLSYDTREDTIAVFSHNLDYAEAQEEARKLRLGSLPAYTLRQDEEHGADDPDNCEQCTAEIERGIRGADTVRG